MVVALMFATAAPAIAAKPSHGGGGGGGGSGSTTTGYDISYPQCGTSFPSSTAFGIVGVNGGLASDLNPCLGPASSYTQSELYWAVAHEGKLYMATVLDLFSRRLLACPTSEHRLSLHSLSRAQRPLATPSPVVRDEEAAGSNPVTPTSVSAGERLPRESLRASFAASSAAKYSRDRMDASQGPAHAMDEAPAVRALRRVTTLCITIDAA